MADALDGYVGTVSIGGRKLTNFGFADDIDGLVGSKKEPRQPVGRIGRASKDFGMKISVEKTKLMTNNNRGMTTDIIHSRKHFKYLVEIISEEVFNLNVIARIAESTAALSSLQPVWSNITLRSKINLMRSLVTSLFMYAYETWTHTVDLQRRIRTSNGDDMLSNTPQYIVYRARHK